MRFYRFELAFDGEPQGVGFLQGADDVGLDNQTYLSLMDPFESLESPYLDEPLGAMFFFTGEGLCRFLSAINAFIDALKPFGWSLIGFVLDEPDYSRSIYHDNDQAAWTQEYLRPMGEGYEVNDAAELLNKPAQL